MFRRPALFCIAVFCLASLSLAADAPSIKINQLRVSKKVGEELQVSMFDSEGTKLAIVVSVNNGSILNLDEDASKLTSATDDKGTDLAENNTEKWVSSFFCKIAKNRQKIAIPVSLGGIPAEGATSIQIKGDIVLNCGSDEKTETIKTFNVGTGTSQKFGEHSIEIKLNKDEAGDDKTAMPLQVVLNENGTWLKSITFVDEKGKTLKADESGWSSGNDVKTASYTIKSAVEKIGAKVTYFQKTEQVTKTIDMKIGLGLP